MDQPDKYWQQGNPHQRSVGRDARKQCVTSYQSVAIDAAGTGNVHQRSYSSPEHSSQYFPSTNSSLRAQQHNPKTVGIEKEQTSPSSVTYIENSKNHPFMFMDDNSKNPNVDSQASSTGWDHSAYSAPHPPTSSVCSNNENTEFNTTAGTSHSQYQGYTEENKNMLSATELYIPQTNSTHNDGNQSNNFHQCNFTQGRQSYPLSFDPVPHYINDTSCSNYNTNNYPKSSYHDKRTSENMHSPNPSSDFNNIYYTTQNKQIVPIEVFHKESGQCAPVHYMQQQHAIKQQPDVSSNEQFCAMQKPVQVAVQNSPIHVNNPNPAVFKPNDSHISETERINRIKNKQMYNMCHEEHQTIQRQAYESQFKQEKQNIVQQRDQGKLESHEQYCLPEERLNNESEMMNRRQRQDKEERKQTCARGRGKMPESGYGKEYQSHGRGNDAVSHKYKPRNPKNMSRQEQENVAGLNENKSQHLYEQNRENTNERASQKLHVQQGRSQVHSKSTLVSEDPRHDRKYHIYDQDSKDDSQIYSRQTHKSKHTTRQETQNYANLNKNVSHEHERRNVSEKEPQDGRRCKESIATHMQGDNSKSYSKSYLLQAELNPHQHVYTLTERQEDNLASTRNLNLDERALKGKHHQLNSMIQQDSSNQINVCHNQLEINREQHDGNYKIESQEEEQTSENKLETSETLSQTDEDQAFKEDEQRRKSAIVKQLESIASDIEELRKHIVCFSGNRQHIDYRYLGERLTRNLIKLNNVETEGYLHICTLRKGVIKQNKECLKLLKEKAKEWEKLKQLEEDMKLEQEKKLEEAKKLKEAKKWEEAKRLEEAKEWKEAKNLVTNVCHNQFEINHKQHGGNYKIESQEEEQIFENKLETSGTPSQTDEDQALKQDEQRRKSAIVKQLECIASDIEELRKQIVCFSGSRQHKDYRYLDEMLTRNLIKLDNVETEGDLHIRTVRKKVIKQNKEYLKMLEGNAKDWEKAKELEETLKLEEEKRLEEAKKLEEAEKLEEEKRLEEAKKLEEAEKLEEGKKWEEAKRLEETKQWEEWKKLEEAKRLED